MHRRFPCSSGPDSTQSTHHEVNGHAVWKHDTPAIIIVDITRPHWPCSLDQGTAGFYAHTPGTTAAWSHLRCRVGHTGGTTSRQHHFASVPQRRIPLQLECYEGIAVQFPDSEDRWHAYSFGPSLPVWYDANPPAPVEHQDCSRRGTTKHPMLLLMATPLGSCKVTCCGYPLMPRRRPEELPSTV